MRTESGTYGTDTANMLFHVVNDRHRHKRTMIFTTNKPLNAWGRVLHDEDLALAIVDRVLERGRLLTLDGPSMRTKHLGLDDATSPEASHQLARISGIDRPEFPAPPKKPKDYQTAGNGAPDNKGYLVSRGPALLLWRLRGRCLRLTGHRRYALTEQVEAWRAFHDRGSGNVRRWRLDQAGERRMAEQRRIRRRDDGPSSLW